VNVAVQDIAAAHLKRQQALGRRAARAVARLWAAVDPKAIAITWTRNLPAALTVMESAQTTAAAAAGPYLDKLAKEYGLPDASAGDINTVGFAGMASDGRELDTLLYQSAISALRTIQRGGSESQALAAGRFTADMIVRTQVADAGRAADGVALVARPQLTGWVRMLSLPSCSRCIVLAGRVYTWNQGFLRHPRCDCRHIPVIEDVVGEVVTNPKAYFDSLAAVEQDRIFTKSGAQAIRDGADISQVVNSRRGAVGLTPAGPRMTGEEVRALRGGRTRGRLQASDVLGQQLFTTLESAPGRGRRGAPRRARLMPESIYQISGDDRDEAIRLLRVHGYLR
jgi:hypothetical protein